MSEERNEMSEERKAKMISLTFHHLQKYSVKMKCCGWIDSFIQLIHSFDSFN